MRSAFVAASVVLLVSGVALADDSPAVPPVAEALIADYINHFYNPGRLHSTVGYMSPSLTNSGHAQPRWPHSERVHETGGIPPK